MSEELSQAEPLPVVPAEPVPLAPVETIPGAPAPRNRIFPNLWQAFLLLALFLGLTGVVGYVALPLQRFLPDQLWFFLVLLVGEGLGVFAGLRLARWPLRQVLSTLGFPVATLGRLLAIGLGNLLLVGVLLYLVALLFGPIEPGVLAELFSVRSPLEFLILFLTVAIAAPFLEELLMRGILLRGLALSRGARAGIVWTAFFFAVIHMNPLQAGPAFVNGLVWGIVLIRTGSLGATLFLHSLNNALVFLLVQVSMRAAHAEPEALPVPTLGEAALIVATGLVGVTLVLSGLAALPRSPERLAAFWGVPVLPPRALQTTAEARG